MESARFDALTRRLAGSATRRGALAGLGALLSRLLPGAVGAQPRVPCREFGRTCNTERNIDCCPGTTCRNGRCRCPEGKRRCQGECRSVRRCCDGHCGGGAVCRDGRCVCPAGSRRCGERCVSRTRCCPGQKRCGERCIRQAACCGGCPTGQVCRSGRCERTGCATGTKPCNGRCIQNDACCGGCGTNQVCEGGRCVAAVCNNGGPCRVFVTSERFSGDLREGGTGSGIVGADAKCQRLATASALTRGGTYKAWLSGDALASSPSQRFTYTGSTGPYVLVDPDATVLATSWADLTDGTLRTPINVTEHGLPVTGITGIWTHTLPTGLPGGYGNVLCAEWTSADDEAFGDFGSALESGERWTKVSHASCDQRPRLYCFEQG